MYLLFQIPGLDGSVNSVLTIPACPRGSRGPRSQKGPRGSSGPKCFSGVTQDRSYRSWSQGSLGSKCSPSPKDSMGHALQVDSKFHLLKILDEF